VSALVLMSFALTLPSFGHNQNANSSTTQNANSSTPNQNDQRSMQDFSKNTWELPEDADKTKNPIVSSAESIEKGKALFLERTKGNCIFCHGETGAGNEANLPRLRRKPADLSNKRAYDGDD
jgi:cytochrome c553